jgi:hypothetical protein
MISLVPFVDVVILGKDATIFQDLSRRLLTRHLHCISLCFHKVLVETIEVLEETKKALKSKRLEELRKRLMDVLKESA